MTIGNDRVRKHTAAAVLRRIDGEMEERLAQHASQPDTVAAREEALDREWDVDRTIEVEASLMGLIGLALGTTVRRELLAVPLVVGSAVLLYAFTGRYPLLPIFRRLGFRTAREIARERFALKALRGDFVGMDAARDQSRPGSTNSADNNASQPIGLVGAERPR